MSRARLVNRSVAAAVGLLALLAASACASGSSSSKEPGRTKVRVMLDWTPNTNHGGMYLAKAEGYYRAAGLDVTFIQPGQGADVNQVVAQGTVDFGVSAAEQLVPARTAGVPVTEIPQEGATETDTARSQQWRDVGLGAQILKDLGISSIRLLSSSHRTYVGLGGFGIEIAGTEVLES